MQGIYLNTETVVSANVAGNCVTNAGQIYGTDFPKDVGNLTLNHAASYVPAAANQLYPQPYFAPPVFPQLTQDYLPNNSRPIMVNSGPIVSGVVTGNLVVNCIQLNTNGLFGNSNFGCLTVNYQEPPVVNNVQEAQQLFQEGPLVYGDLHHGNQPGNGLYAEGSHPNYEESEKYHTTDLSMDGLEETHVDEEMTEY